MCHRDKLQGSVLARLIYPRRGVSSTRANIFFLLESVVFVNTRLYITVVLGDEPDIASLSRWRCDAPVENVLMLRGSAYRYGGQLLGFHVRCNLSPSGPD